MCKNAIVIGATSGIGKALSKILVNNGYKVAITGRRLDKLKEIHLQDPDKYIIKQFDVTDITASEKAFKELILIFDKVDLIIHSSGVGNPNYELNWQNDLPTLQTNVLGATRIYQLAYNIFKQQGYGHLVGITSVASIRGNRHVPAYFASKAYQSSYLESLWMKAERSKNSNITITNILPGFVDTKMAIGSTFWKSSLSKAANQMYKAIKKKKKKAYITKRWKWVACLLYVAPTKMVIKYL